MMAVRCTIFVDVTGLSPSYENDNGGNNGDEEHEGSEGPQGDHGTDVQPRAHGVPSFSVHWLRNIDARSLLSTNVVAGTEDLK